MKYDRNIKDTYYFIERDLMLVNTPGKPDYGKGDSIGRTLNAYFTYEDQQLIEGIKSCWRKIEYKSDVDGHIDYYFRGQRYPEEYFFPFDFSRDHTIATFSALILADDPFIVELGDKIRKKLRDDNNPKHKINQSLWLWIKIISGYKKWWYKPAYYFLMFWEIIFAIIINKLTYLLGGFKGELKQENFIPVMDENKSRWKLFWKKIHFPQYAVNKLGWQLFVMEDKPIIRFLQKLSIPLIPKYNYLHKLMFNVRLKSFSKEDILSYKPMLGWRWTTTLNDLNDRDLKIITDNNLLKCNVLDVDLLIKFWNYRHSKNKI